jgi:hypothetical protein
MSVPSIKGAAIVAAVADLNRLLEEGRISREVLEARLEAEDLKLLEEKIQLAIWYPIASYGRIADLLAEIEAGAEGREAYLARRGHQTADRLFAAGIYEQLKRAEGRVSNLDDDGGFDPHEVRTTLSLWGSMLNFSGWHYRPDRKNPRSFTCEVFDAASWPEALRLANEGFLEGVFSRLAKAPVQVRSEVIGPDRFVYRTRVVSGDD